MLIEILSCILIADFISGLVHWTEDTYLAPTGLKWFDNYIVYPNIAHHEFGAKSMVKGYWNNNGI